MTISVRFEDTSEYFGNYRFRPLSSFGDMWSVPPRVDDCIMDLNEMKYRVIEVRWWDPGSVTVLIKRAN